jgi:2,3-bisphosphoglycerate-dependent phosphoglycerate mutase
MELYIIRHGQSVNNALMEDARLRVHDPELTETGHQQAERVARYLAKSTNLEDLVRIPVNDTARQNGHRHRITHLYCSAMHRALQTARPIGQALGLKPEIWLEIHEHGGIYLEKEGVITGHGGRTRAEIVAEFPDYVLPETITEAGWWPTDNGAEDISACQARAIRVAAELRARAADEMTRHDVVALVSHGGFIDCLLKALLNNLPGSTHYYSHYNTAITRVDFIDDGTLILRCTNRIEHLPPELVT